MIKKKCTNVELWDWEKKKIIFNTLAIPIILFYYEVSLLTPLVRLGIKLANQKTFHNLSFQSLMQHSLPHSLN
jgi:hypothetical protein